MFYDSLSVQGKCRMHCSRWHCPGLSRPGAYTREEVVPGHRPPGRGGPGHCLLFGSQSSQNSQTGSGPQANRVPLMRCVTLLAFYSPSEGWLFQPWCWFTFAVCYLTLLYWSCLSRKSLSFHKPWQLPWSAADLPQFEKQNVFWLHLKEVWDEFTGEDLAVTSLWAEHLKGDLALAVGSVPGPLHKSLCVIFPTLCLALLWLLPTRSFCYIIASYF